MNAHDSSRALSASPEMKNKASFLRRYHQQRRVNRRSIEEKWKRMCGVLVTATWGSGPGKKDGNVSLDCSPCRHANQEKKMETRVRAARKVDMRPRRERWKRVCGLFAASTKGPGKKDGNACAEWLLRRQGAQEKKMETCVRVVRSATLRTEKGGGNEWSGCLPHEQAAQVRKMET